MSGGSFNYAYRHELHERRVDIDGIARDLHELGFHDAAARTEAASRALRDAEALRRELEEVWYAVEWCASGDTGPDHIAENVAKWRAKAAEVPAEAVDVSRRLHDIAGKATKVLCEIEELRGRALRPQP
jgi:hypothetical protein